MGLLALWVSCAPKVQLLGPRIPGAYRPWRDQGMSVKAWHKNKASIAGVTGNMPAPLCS